MGNGYKKRQNFNDFVPIYNDVYTKEMDEEGLRVLKWSMLDSPDSLGSGKRFMESEPVKILDLVFSQERLKGFVHLGYTSKAYADKLGLGVNSEHRVGKAIKFRCINASHRFRLVRRLIQYGIERIRLTDEYVYFDTERYLHKEELSFRHF
tara:strand:- start:281 stop:733 length:453 start_codon:yes stop_codon:yes gene_type:complete